MVRVGRRRCSARRARSLAEGDLVAGLFAGQLDLTLPQLADDFLGDGVAVRLAEAVQAADGVELVTQLGQLVGQLDGHGRHTGIERRHLRR